MKNFCYEKLFAVLQFSEQLQAATLEKIWTVAYSASTNFTLLFIYLKNLLNKTFISEKYIQISINLVINVSNVKYNHEDNWELHILHYLQSTIQYMRLTQRKNIFIQQRNTTHIMNITTVWVNVDFEKIGGKLLPVNMAGTIKDFAGQM